MPAQSKGAKLPPFSLNQQEFTPEDSALVYHPPKVASSSPIEALFEKVFGQDGTNRGQNGVALGQDGDFDPDQFVESTLSQARGGSADNTAITIGSIFKLLGIGG